jgi:flagellar biosynthetic protein FliP
MKRAIAIVILLLSFAVPAFGQFGPPAEPPAAAAPREIVSLDPSSSGELAMNPLRVLDQAASAIASRDRGGGGGAGAGAGEGAGLSAALNIMIVLTVISLVPSIMLLCTSFLRILVVLGLLKQAIGAQSLPPPQVVTGLALFMTLLVMSPTIDRIWKEAVVPYQEGVITGHDELWLKARQPLRDFMFDQIEATGDWSSVYMILNYRGIDTTEPERLTRADVDMVSLVPAYVLSELKVAFLMGFRIYLPFLVIDMVIASILISMSMMMLPPVLISLPFKLLLFILVDGWQLTVGGLLSSFAVGGAPVTDPVTTGAMLDAAGSIWAGVEVSIAALIGHSR